MPEPSLPPTQRTQDARQVGRGSDGLRVSDDVDVIVQSYGALKTAVADKQLRALASTTAGRAAYLPEVPSVHEVGVTGFEVVTWNGFFVSSCQMSCARRSA